MAGDDDRGIALLERRVASIEENFHAFRESTRPERLSLRNCRRVVLTGIGSSEAVARFAMRNLEMVPEFSLQFCTTSQFFGTLPFDPADAILVVVSQGLSPNSRIALERRKEFAGTVLLTAATVEGQRNAGRPDRALLLESLEAEGAVVLEHPLEEEFSILPRVVGPFCGLLAAVRLADVLKGAGESSLPYESIASAAFGKNFPQEGEVDTWAAELLRGVDFYCTGGTSAYASNLAFKVMECTFRRSPGVYEIFDYSHGPFQVDTANPRHRWIFAGSTPAERDLLERFTPLFEEAGPFRILQSELPAPFEIFEFEMALNRISVRAAALGGVDLANWPGKGKDGPGYDLKAPFGSPEPR